MIPLKYSVRNLRVRWVNTLFSVLATGLVAVGPRTRLAAIASTLGSTTEEGLAGTVHGATGCEAGSAADAPPHPCALSCARPGLGR